MYTVENMKEKNKLAKTLVDHKIYSNFQDAVNEIKFAGFTEYDGERVNTNMPNQTGSQQQGQGARPVQSGAGQPAQHNDVHLRKIEVLTQQIQQMGKFIQDYKQKNDSNLRELDNRLKGVEGGRFQASHATANPTVEEAPHVQVQTQTQQPRPRDQSIEHPQKKLDVIASQFSVENIFSNAGGKLAKK